MYTTGSESLHLASNKGRRLTEARVRDKKLRRKFLKAQKIIRPNDIIVNSKNKYKIKIQEEIEKKPVVSDISSIEMQYPGCSSAIFHNDSTTVRVEALEYEYSPADSYEEDQTSPIVNDACLPESRLLNTISTSAHASFEEDKSNNQKQIEDLKSKLNRMQNKFQTFIIRLICLTGFPEEFEINQNQDSSDNLQRLYTHIEGLLDKGSKPEQTNGTMKNILINSQHQLAQVSEISCVTDITESSALTKNDDDIALDLYDELLASQAVFSPSTVLPNYSNLSCGICKKGVRNKRSLAMHKRIHNRKPKQHQCTICSKIFTRKQSLVYHQANHASSADFGCIFCDESFRHQERLDAHIRSHTGELPFSCDICGKLYKDAKSKNNHQRAHKPFKCVSCEIFFNSRGDYNNHKKVTHSNKISKLVCPFCPEPSVFTVIHTLNDHVRAHCGEKPYHCRMCKSEFSSSQQTRRHEIVCKDITANVC